MENAPSILSLANHETVQSPVIGNLENTGPISTTAAITIRVARTEDVIANHFVVSFAKKGPLTCQELLKEPSITKLLNKAESEGVQIDEPALLASSDETGVARTLYLTPIPGNSFRDFAVWVGHVSETISNFKANRVGLYLCKGSLPATELADLVNQTVRVLVETKIVKDICLIVGQHAYNEVLATALHLKHELDGPYAALHVLH